jgi:hypothetical protein
VNYLSRSRSNRKLFVPVEWSILMLVLLVLSLPAIRKHWCKPADLRPCTWTIYAMYGNILCGPCSEGLNDIMKRWRQQVNFYLRNPSAMTLHLHNSLLYLHQICFFQNYLSPLDPSFDFFLKEAQSFTTIFICMWVAIDNVKLGPCILPSHNDVNPVIWETLVVIKW